MNYNIKTKARHLVQAGILASFFIASSAQAVFINKYTYCPSGTTMLNVTQYQMMLEPQMLTTILSGGSSSRVMKSNNIESGSWYSSHWTSRVAPVTAPQTEYRSSMVVLSTPGMISGNKGFDYKTVMIRNIVPSGDYDDRGGLNFYPSCMVLTREI